MHEPHQKLQKPQFAYVPQEETKAKDGTEHELGFGTRYSLAWSSKDGTLKGYFLFYSVL